ncbi:hypothetical protein G3545_10745 [Starkeya sp. ORNL1]|uniref:hypothetical protein n=1 Tax=Starkeya sp. ORNL1 TaxID=2709380 RepID=UPI0014644726|nr:hypothetical protein [Starkeya sp. ORNL1]QJP14084.1 hypothetical protein G3545_10745 [Starkeya sp. ORNL1]
MHDQINAREYKLLLDVTRFGHAPSLDAANGFWNERLKPIIDKHLDKPRRGSRYERQFDKTVERTIHFFDSETRQLDGCGYSLRKRAPVKGKARPEITLKLRLADLFAVATTELPARDECADPQFEEDIAPLEVADPKRAGVVTIADPPSIRSRFALSTSQSLPPAARLRTFADAFRLYPTLKENLAAARAQGAPNVSPRTPLRCGPKVQETVFRGARVRFGDGIVGKLDLTHWHLADPAPEPRVLEISYTCDIVSRPMTGAAARRAFGFFTAMQHDLGALVNLRFTSKTELALPGFETP